MLKIYHNPRCAKSREGLAVLQESGKPFEEVLYMKNAPSVGELKQMLSALKKPAIDLIRKNETIWRSEYKNKKLTEDELVGLMHKHPNLIERPVVMEGNKAVIGRPAEKIVEFLKSPS